MIRWAGRAGILAGSLVASVLLLEGAVRLVLPQPLPNYLPGTWVPDDTGLGHRLAADLDAVVNTGERDVRFRTDGLGHRIGESGPSDRPAALRIVALGDSFLEAMAVSYEETVTGRLEARLAARSGDPVVVVNTGVSGTTPNHYRMWAERELARRPADAVVVFLFLGNDIIDHRLDSLPVRPPQLVEPLRLPRSLAPREWIEALVHPAYTAVRQRSQLAVLLKSRALEAMIALGLTNHSFPAIYLPSEISDVRWDVTTAICLEIAHTAERAGAVSLVVFLPPDYAVDPELGDAFARSAGLAAGDYDFGQPARLLGDRLRANAVAVLDATPVLRAALTESGEALYGRVDRHLSPAGHRVVARAVEARLAEALALPRAAE